MGKKQISILIGTSLLTLLLGLIIGQFVQIPTFKAAEDPPSTGLQLARIPAADRLDPETGRRNRVDVIASFRNADPYNCPAGYDPNPTAKFPFYKSRVIAGLKKDNSRPEDFGAILPEKETKLFAGYNAYYDIVSSGTTISAKLARTEKVHAIGQVREYEYVLYPLPDADDILALQLVPDLPVKVSQSKLISLCTKAAASGGGSGNGGN